MKPRPADLATLVRLLPDGAVVLAFDLETCAAPGGDARVPGKARVVQLGVAAFSGAPLPEVGGEPVVLSADDLQSHGPATDSIDDLDFGNADSATTAQSEVGADETGDDHRCAGARADGVQVAGYLFADQTYVDPRCPIDAGSQAVHRITQAQVRGQPQIGELADWLKTWLECDGRPVYLCGHNAAKYDVPALAAELRRVDRGDVADLLTSRPILDTMLIRKAADPPNTLLGCMQRYGLGDLDGEEHNAAADVAGTLAVLAAQAACGHFSAVDDAAGLASSATKKTGDEVDAEGKLLWAKGADRLKPTPETVIVNFTKHKGSTLKAAGSGLGKWICAQAFVGDDAKAVIRAAFGPSAARW